MGDAGVGKSVIAAALAKRTRADGRLGACYFCCHNDSTRNNPRNLIGTVAFQLCKYNMEYRTKVGGESSVRNILANFALELRGLFTKLLQEPLGKCNTFSQRMLVIIDALDETNYKSREDFLELLKTRFPLLPKWLVFFITSRPENTVQFYLQRYNPCIKICAGNGQDEDDYRQHEADIRRFLKKKVNFSDLPYSVEEVVARCNGLFLYAYYISQVLSDETSSIKGVNLADHFPGDIESFFLTNFKRVFDKLSEAGLYWKLFGCVIAAPPPLPLSFISFIIEKEKSNLDVHTIIDAVSQFVVVRTSDNTFLFLHNLIPSWLTSEDKARKLFIDRGKASDYFKEIILTFLHCALSDEPEGDLSINSKVLHYLLHVGVRFLCFNYDNRDTMTTVFSCLTSFHFLQKRVNIDRLEIFSVVSDYKLCLECHHLADADKEILQEICTTLEENIHVLVECPHLLSSCLQCTSDATQKKFSGDTLMTCKSFDWIPYVAPTMSSKYSYFASSPDKKPLAEGNPNTRIVCIYDASSLKELLGPVEWQLRTCDPTFSTDGKFLLFETKSAGLSTERGCVEEIPLSYGAKRVTETPRHCDGCFPYAFFLWAKLELSQNEDCHSEEFRLRKARCLLEVAKGFLENKWYYFSAGAVLNQCCSVLETKGLKDCQQTLDAHLCRFEDFVIDCRDCHKYYAQEPSLTAVIQRIAGTFRWFCFLERWIFYGPLEFDFFLCVIVLSLMNASRELPSSEQVVLRNSALNDIVQSSPNGKLIACAVRDPVTDPVTDPVNVIKRVEAFAFTCKSDFVVYVQNGVRCFQALSLQTGSILSCDSGFRPVFHIQSRQACFVFSAGSEESIILLDDFPVSSSLMKYLEMPKFASKCSPSGVTFTLGGNVLSLSSNLMLSVLERKSDEPFTTNWAPLEFDREITPLSGVEICALSRQGNLIAISQKASIFLFCDRSFHCTVFKESEDIGCQVSCLIFSHDNTLLLYCVERRNSEAEVCIWNVLQKKPSFCFFASTLVSINCCCFSPDDSMVILCGELRIEIWEDVLCSRQCLKMVKEMNQTWPYQTNERFHYCSVSSGNKLLACCVADDVVLCSLCSPAEESFCRLPGGHLGQIQFCQFLRETRYLISYGIDGAVFLWDLYERKAAAFARVAERDESIQGMSISGMEDKVVCLISSGRVITIKLHGLKSATLPLPPLRDLTQSSSALGAGGGYLSQEPEIDKLFEDMDVIACDESEEDSDVEEIQV